MNEKIDIYTLLGLIKDGKAPKKIRYGLTEWFYDDNAKDYFKGEDNVVSLQMTYVSNPKWLNLEVEILDKEYIGKESIEKTIEFLQEGMKCIIKQKELINKYSKDEFIDIERIHTLINGTKNEERICYTINNLIVNQKKIIERVDK